MSQLRVSSIRRMKAEFQLPGDKSISHRSAIFTSLAAGPSRITGFLPSEDCLCTLRIMQALGTQIERLDETTFSVQGRNRKFLKPAEALDCGNSGTTMRLMAGILAAQSFETTMFGDASLTRRPMKRVVDPLTSMGAKITCKGENFRAPLVIQGSPLKGISYHTPIPSAQVKSCVLLAGLLAEDKTSVEEDLPSRDHTERMLRHFHASMAQEDRKTTVYGGHTLQAENIDVPGDFSSAAFWLVAAAALPGGRLFLHNVGLNPTRTGLLNILMRMGASITEQIRVAGPEPVGNLLIQEGSALHATEIGGDEIPNVIDEIPILAVAAALAEGTTLIRDAQELRVKESDRLKSLATNLRAFGVPVEEHPDGLTIEGKAPLHGARVTSYGDHRIAMASAILGLFAKGETIVDDVDCIATSYPTFPKHLELIKSGKPVKDIRPDLEPALP